jgi:hypothetical protein
MMLADRSHTPGLERLAKRRFSSCSPPAGGREAAGSVKITKAARNWLGNKLDTSRRNQIIFMDRDGHYLMTRSESGRGSPVILSYQQQ